MPDDVVDIDDVVDVVGDPTPTSGEGESDSQGEGDDPESPEGDSATSEDDDDSPADEDGDEDSSDDEDGEGKDGAAPTDSLHDKLLAKYGGDKEKFAEAVLEQGNSLSALTEDVKAIREALKARGTPEEEERAIATAPEVQELTASITTLKAEINSAAENQRNAAAEHGRITIEIAKLEGALKYADDEKRPQIQQELAQAKADLKSALQDHNMALKEFNNGQKEMQKLARDYRKAVVGVKAERAAAAEAALKQATAVAETRREFNEYIRSATKQYGIDPSSVRYKRCHETTKARISQYLRTLPEGTPEIDLKRAVQLLVDEYAEDIGLKKTFQKRSTQKHETEGEPTKGPKVLTPLPKGVKEPKPGQAWTTEYAKARAKRLMP